MMQYILDDRRYGMWHCVMLIQMEMGWPMEWSLVTPTVLGSKVKRY